MTKKKHYVKFYVVTKVKKELIGQYRNKFQNKKKYSKRFLLDYYPNIERNSIYRNTIMNKEVKWEGHIKDLKYLKVENFLGWELSFDGEHSLSNHSPISHWGLKNGST